MLDHCEQYLRTGINRNGRPYARKTREGYLHCATLPAKWLDEQRIPGDLTAACDPRVLSAFLRHYFETRGQNGAAFVYRNLQNLFR